MLTSIEIQNFKSFSNLKNDSLEKVNIITGSTNSGKTNLLQAVLIHLDSTQKGLSKIPTFQNDFNFKFNRLFHNHNSIEPIILNSNLDSVILKITAYEDYLKLDCNNEAVRVPYLYINQNNDSMSRNTISMVEKLRESVNEILFVKFLQLIDRNIDYIETIDNVLSIVNKSGYSFNLESYGNKFKNYMRLISALIETTDSVILIDDIENFVDRKVCDFIIMGILDLVQINNNQLFITTNDSNIVNTFKKYSKVDVGVNVINMD